jgi:hypothetical protein
LVNDAVTTLKIMDANVTAAKLTAGVGTAGRVGVADATGVVTYGNLPATSITGNNLTSTDLTVTGGTGATLTAVTLDIANNAVTNAKMADNAIGNAEMLDNAINTAELIDGAVTSLKIADGTIMNGDINTAAAIALSKLAYGTNAQIIVGSATGVPTYVNMGGDVTIANDGTTTITANAVSTNEIADNSITNVKMADNAIGNAEMLDNAVNTSELVNNAVTTPKIMDANVTASKLTAGVGTAGRVGVADAAGVVTYGNLPATSITGNNLTSTDLTVTGGTGATLTAVTLDIANNAITNIKMADNAIGNAEMLDNAVNTNELVNDAITTAKILNSNVTYAKIQNISATNKVLGRVSAGAGVVEEISTTGSGDVVRSTSPTLITPNLGTPTTLIGTNITGTAAGLTAGNVTTNANLTGMVTSIGNATTVVTNANLTGEVTSVGNATTIAANAVTTAKISDANVTYAKIQNIAALSVFGRSTNAAGVGAAISAIAAGNGILRESGSTIGFGSINLASSGAVGASILPVANGGTGQSAALVPGGVLYGSTATAAGVTAAGTSGMFLRSNGAAAPSWQNGGGGDMVAANAETVSGVKTFTALPIFSTLTVGSVPFIGAGKALSEDNANLFWDDSNNRLGIGTAAPAATLTVAGDVYISGTGSNTTNPRTVGINPWVDGNAARYTFGDPQNALQNAFGKMLQIYAWWGVEIYGNRQNMTPLVFHDGDGSEPALNVVGSTTTAPVLAVTAATGQSGNLQEWRNSTPIVLAAVSSAGKISTSGGATINGAFNYGVDGAGGGNSFAITLNPAPTSYIAGQMVIFKAGNNNTASCTMNVNGLGARTILLSTGGTLASGDITSGGVYILVYDGTNFYLIH